VSQVEKQFRQLLGRAVMTEHKFSEDMTRIEIRFTNSSDCCQLLELLEGEHAPIKLTQLQYKTRMPRGDFTKMGACTLSKMLNAGHIGFQITDQKQAEEFLRRFGDAVHQSFKVDWLSAGREDLPPHILDEERCIIDEDVYAAWLKTPEAKRIAPNFVKREETREAIEVCLEALGQHIQMQVRAN
jgi:hypothetical protein